MIMLGCCLVDRLGAAGGCGVDEAAGAGAAVGAADAGTAVAPAAAAAAWFNAAAVGAFTSGSLSSHLAAATPPETAS